MLGKVFDKRLTKCGISCYACGIANHLGSLKLSPITRRSYDVEWEETNMANNSSIPDFQEISALISYKFATLRAPYLEWANLARLAIQGLPFNRRRLSELEDFIDAQRDELRKAVIIASEHFEEALLIELRNQANMSKTAWRSLKKNGPITIKNGFTLVSY
jgi:hypothetical protein